MKNVLFLICSFIMLAAFSCDKDRFARDLLILLDHVPSDFYLNDDPFAERHMDLYGVWEATDVSHGGVPTDLIPEFDYFLLKQNGIFGVVEDEILVASGQLRLVSDTNTMLEVELNLEPGTSRLLLHLPFHGTSTLQYDDQEMTLFSNLTFHHRVYSFKKIY